MAIEVAGLSVKVTPDGVKQTSDQLKDLSGSSRQAESSIASFAKSVAGYTTAAGLAVDVTKRVLSGIKDLAVESVKLAAGFEKAKITWGVLMGDMAKGEDVFNQLRQFAAETPLSFEGLESAAQTLAGFGVEADDLINVLGRLGDLSRGDNSALGRLALVFGQVRAQGKAMTQDLYQFVNSGVPIFNLLADSMGVTAGEIKELTSEGKIGFAEIEAAIRKATDEGGQFFGMMEKTAQTTAGKWSTAMDNARNILAEIGQTFLPMVNAGLDAFNAGVEQASGRQLVSTVMSGKGTVEEAEAAVSFARKELEYYQNMRGYGRTEDEQAHLARLREELSLLQRIHASRAMAAGARKVTAGSAPSSTTAAAPKADPFAGQGMGYGVELFSDMNTARMLGNLDGLYVGLTDLGFATASLIDADVMRTNQLQYADKLTAQYADRSVMLQEEIERVGQAYERGDISAQTYVLALEELNEQLERLDPLAVASKEAINSLTEQLKGLAMNASIDVLMSIGEAMAAGSGGAESMEQALAALGIQILNQLPLMLLSAGLQLVTIGQWEIGLPLIAASGIVAIGAGAANYGYSNTQKPVTANAMGGVYSSPSLSAYSGGVYDKPQFFAFARGGVFAEAGPEAIMPLAKTSSGHLGVRAEGASTTIQVIINNNAQGVAVNQSEQTAPDGTKQIVLTVENIVRSMVPAGKLDPLLARGGVRPVGVRG